MGNSETRDKTAKTKTENEEGKIQRKSAGKKGNQGLKRAALGIAITLGFFLANWARTTNHFGLLYWVLYGVAILALALIYTYIPSKSWASKKQRLLLKVIFVLVVTFGALIVYLGQRSIPVPETLPPFRGRVLSVYQPFDDSKSLLVYALNESGQKRLRNISRIVLLEVTNQQLISTNVVSFSLDKLTANNQWERLDAINVADPVAFYSLTNNDKTKAKQLDFTKCCFNTLAGNTLLDQGQSIRGLVFLDDPQPNYKVEHFRLVVENSQGQKQALLLDYHLNVEKGLNALGLCEFKVMPRLADISLYNADQK